MRTYDQIAADFAALNQEFKEYARANPEEHIVLFNTIGKIEMYDEDMGKVIVSGSLTGGTQDIITIFAQPENEAYEALTKLMARREVREYMKDIMQDRGGVDRHE